MKTLNKTMTIEEATELLNSTSGMTYPATEHNKMMIKKAVDNLLLSLRAAV
jgi:hypothetical protein